MWEGGRYLTRRTGQIPIEIRTELAQRDAAVSSSPLPLHNAVRYRPERPDFIAPPGLGSVREDPPSHEPRAAPHGKVVRSGAEEGKMEPT